MISWRDPSWFVLPNRASVCDNEDMNPLTQARAALAGALARRVATDPQTGRILVSSTSTHLLARRAAGGVWA